MSYHRVSWLSKTELRQFGFDVTSNSLKTLANRMRKTQELKLPLNSHFNPNYLVPDRILNSSEVFTAIHHKRANDIKGKWDESILMVIQKLVNFVRQGYPLGSLFIDAHG